MTRRVRVTLVYETYINTEHYPVEERGSPTTMVEGDIEIDPAVILTGDNMDVKAEWI